MLEFLADYAGFLIRLLSIALIVLLIVAVVAGSKGKQRKGNLSVVKLNEGYKAMKEELRKQLHDKKALKKEQKALKKEQKAKAKEKSKETSEAPAKRVYVLDFDGDIKIFINRRMAM